MTEHTANENTCDVQESLSAVSDLYKNVTMAQNCIKTLQPYAKEDAVAQSLSKQVERYNEYANQILQLAKNLNFKPTAAPKGAITMANWGIKAKMMTDQSLSHLAKIMLQGTLNGIVDLYRLVRRKDLHPDVVSLARQILLFEEQRFEGLKGWL